MKGKVEHASPEPDLYSKSFPVCHCLKWGVCFIHLNVCPVGRAWKGLVQVADAAQKRCKYQSAASCKAEEDKILWIYHPKSVCAAEPSAQPLLTEKLLFVQN